MSNIEILIFLLLLFMAVPDLCRKLGRPALGFSAFVVFGILLAPFASAPVVTMLQQAGHVGFLLLLFEVGLEIELPPWRDLLRPLRHAVLWALVQYPVACALASIAGLDWMRSLVAAAALTACSVGMAYPAWKNYPGLTGEVKRTLLHVMVALEVMAIIVLAVETTALKTGWSWVVLLKLAGIGLTIFLIARFAAHLEGLFQTILDRTTHWRVHWLVLLVLSVCALGERLGLDATKTAFFLGLAMSRARRDGMRLEDWIAPVSRRFLVPLFFVALGLQIDWRFLLGWNALLAVGPAGLLLGAREMMHRRWFSLDQDPHAFLLLCPNLTMVALAAKALLDSHTDPALTAWLVLTGLFMSVPVVMLLPAGVTERPDGTGQGANDSTERVPAAAVPVNEAGAGTAP